MIYSVTGTIEEISTTSIILSVGTLSIELQTPSNNQYNKKESITLYTYLHWHTEQGPSLYGFTERAQKELFCLLLSCSGIGPKIALSLLSNLSTHIIIDAIVTGNSTLLSNTPGIGTKKAEHIIIHAKDKIHKIKTYTAHQTSHDWEKLSEALKSLGYSKTEIQKAVSTLFEKQNEYTSFEQLMRAALNILYKK